MKTLQSAATEAVSPISKVLDFSQWYFEPATGPLSASLKVVCAWCKQDMGSRACVPEQAGKTSHTICPACAKKYFSMEVGCEL